MQKPEFKKIINEIDDILTRYLIRKYNPNVSEKIFTNSEILSSENSVIEIDDNGYALEISAENNKFHINKFDYRIPQTRIYYSEIQNQQFNIKLIRYFETFILITDTLNPEFSPTITVTGPNKYWYISFPEQKLLEKKEIVITANSGFICISTNINEYRSGKITDILTACIEKEIHQHPVSAIDSMDQKYLCDLDHAWSEIKYIDQDNQIKMAAILQDNFMNFTWIQEIYLYLGWYEYLDTFYTNIKKNKISADANLILNACEKRYKYISGLLNPNSDQDIFPESSDKLNIEGEYLSYFFTNFHDKAENLYEMIQDRWNYIHLPSISLIFRQKVKDNPDEFIAYAYFALIYGFWWYRKLEHKILKYLSPGKKNIFKFLSLLNRPVNVRFVNQTVYFSNITKLPAKQSHRSILGNFTITMIRRNKEIFFSLLKDDLLTLKIDKAVDFSYQPTTRLVSIKPQLYYPIKENLYEIALVVHGFTLRVPLAWDNFTVLFNNCRFRFIRKKQRYQVTIRFQKNINSICINDDVLQNENKPLIRYYIPVSYSENIFKVAFFNLNGKRITTLHNSPDKILMTGYGLSKYGQIQTNYRLSVKNRKKSYQVNLNKLKPIPIDCPNDMTNIILRARGFDPVMIQQKCVDLFLNKLQYIDPSELLQKLVIYLNDYDRDIGIARKTIYRNLGFIPEIDYLRNIKPDKNKLILILKKNIDEGRIRETGPFELKKFNKKSRQKALWWDSNYIEMLFSEDFYRTLSL